MSAFFNPVSSQKFDWCIDYWNRASFHHVYDRYNHRKSTHFRVIRLVNQPNRRILIAAFFGLNSVIDMLPGSMLEANPHSIDPLGALEVALHGRNLSTLELLIGKRDWSDDSDPVGLTHHFPEQLYVPCEVERQRKEQLQCFDLVFEKRLYRPDQLFPGFREACTLSFVELAQKFLDFGVDPNTRDPEGDGIFHHIARKHNDGPCKFEEVCKFLIGRGVSIGQVDNKNRNPLHAHVSYEYYQIRSNYIDIMLRIGVDPNAQSDCGSSALNDLVMHLHLVRRAEISKPAFKGMDMLLGVFLKYGADLNNTTDKGETPLHSGLRCNKPIDLAIFTHFLKAGADLMLEDNSGVTALKELQDQVESTRCEVRDLRIRLEHRDPLLESSGCKDFVSIRYVYYENRQKALALAEGIVAEKSKSSE
ncbi:MAG: hypothetical protein MMC23_007435 [Stictis urceolatum]|nr:hypothetical protein [Stictis urceolata]